MANGKSCGMFKKIKLIFIPQSLKGKKALIICITLAIMARLYKVFYYEGGTSIAGFVIEVLTTVVAWIILVGVVRCPLVLFGVIKAKEP